MIATCRPNGAGSETAIFYQIPFSGSHYEKVNEASPDDTNYVCTCPLTFPPGDANNSGLTTIADVTYIERVILGLSPYTPESDFNQDGIMNITDRDDLVRFLLGLP